LSGILVPTKGRIEFDGKVLNGLRMNKIVKMGVVLVAQERELFGQMKVCENLELGACVRNDKKAIKADVEQLYENLPILKARKDCLAGTLSGGEQQMLAIARSLMARPKLLMLDEPSAGLAPIIIRKIAQIIKRLQEDGITVLLVEQNVRLALALSTYSYILSSGGIVFSGETRKLDLDSMFRKYMI
jgi:branched-chain amino acid transport system ATP-binding protein